MSTAQHLPCSQKPPNLLSKAAWGPGSQNWWGRASATSIQYHHPHGSTARRQQHTEPAWVQLGLLLIIWLCRISYPHFTASSSFYCLILSFTPHFPGLRHISSWTAAEPREKEQKWVQTIAVCVCWALPWSTLPSSHTLVTNDTNKQQTAVPFKMLPHSNVKEGSRLTKREKV